MSNKGIEGNGKIRKKVFEYMTGDLLVSALQGYSQKSSKGLPFIYQLGPLWRNLEHISVYRKNRPTDISSSCRRAANSRSRFGSEIGQIVLSPKMKSS